MKIRLVSPLKKYYKLLTVSNAEVTKRVSDLSTMVGQLNSKVDANERKVNELYKQKILTSKGGDDFALSYDSADSFVDDERSQ